MANKVIYNGGTQSYYGCSAPTNLIVGKEYEVIGVKDRGWQTDYTLKGVKGEYNSAWFDEPKDRVYMAISHLAPIPGIRYSCSQIEIIEGQPRLRALTTSTVTKVDHMGNNIYRVETRNSVYIVNVG